MVTTLLRESTCACICVHERQRDCFHEGENNQSNTVILFVRIFVTAYSIKRALANQISVRTKQACRNKKACKNVK